MSKSVPDLWIERVALGEATDEQTRAVKDALGDEFEARIEALRADDEAIRAEVPPGRVANEVARRIRREEEVERAPASVKWWVPAGVVAAVAAAVLLWVRPDGETDESVIASADTTAPGDGGPESVYIKGDPRLFVERVDTTEAEPLADGDPVGNGTRLQLSYLAADHVAGVIVSIDGNGAATLHFPASETDDPTLKTGGKFRLDHSYELDDAPRFERFFFVTAPAGTDVDVRHVVEAARELAASPDATAGALALPKPLSQRAITLRKP